MARTGAGDRAASGLLAPRHGERARRGGGGGGGRVFERVAARIGRALPEADRPAFRGVLDAERGRYEGPPVELRATRREVDAATGRESFDPASPRAAMAAWSGRWAAFSAAFGDTMAHAVAAVSPQGRAQAAAARRRDG